MILAPIHEFNHCHNPDGPGGGQFCSAEAELPEFRDASNPNVPGHYHFRFGGVGDIRGSISLRGITLQGKRYGRCSRHDGPRVRRVAAEQGIERIDLTATTWAAA